MATTTLSHPRGYKYYLNATVEPETIKKIDAFRGMIPRSRIVNKALNQYLERELGTKAQGERQSNNR